MAKEGGEKKEAKQVPVKPKKSSGGEMNLIVLIGTIAGTVILMVVVMYFAFHFLIMPELISGISGATGSDSTKSVSHEKTKEHSNKDEILEDLEEDETLLGEEGLHMIETGKLITNPKGSTKFAVVNLALEFRISGKDERFPEGTEINSQNPIIKKILIKLKGRVNSSLGMLTIDDLYAIGSDSLRGKFLADLKPIFKNSKIFLRDVIVTEFLIQ